MEDSQLTSLTNYWAGEVKAEPMYEHSLRGNNNKIEEIMQKETWMHNQEWVTQDTAVVVMY